jgi:hypothetical protein
MKTHTVVEVAAEQVLEAEIAQTILKAIKILKTEEPEQQHQY